VASAARAVRIRRRRRTRADAAPGLGSSRVGSCVAGRAPCGATPAAIDSGGAASSHAARGDRRRCFGVAGLGGRTAARASSIREFACIVGRRSRAAQRRVPRLGRTDAGVAGKAGSAAGCWRIVCADVTAEPTALAASHRRAAESPVRVTTPRLHHAHGSCSWKTRCDGSTSRRFASHYLERDQEHLQCLHCSSACVRSCCQPPRSFPPLARAAVASPTTADAQLLRKCGRSIPRLWMDCPRTVEYVSARWFDAGGRQPSTVNPRQESW